ncbi:hypothetical protein FS749_005531 [Ceratobasidium sp. UAMH 11750]|nr:hypothetical protein FS749_005531 [Ceratobasidium sp. UAMH 11750]
MGPVACIQCTVNPVLPGTLNPTNLASPQSLCTGVPSCESLCGFLWRERSSPYVGTAVTRRGSVIGILRCSNKLRSSAILNV